MKKPLHPAYIAEQELNHDITGVPKVLAEWNWNNTKFLANPAKRGSILKVYDNTGMGGPTAATFANFVTPGRLKKTLSHSSVNWNQYSNTPNIDWNGVPDRDYDPATYEWFTIEQTFYLDVKEAGTWKFWIASDDSHELWINGTKVTSHYGGREMDPQQYTESGSYTFPTAGKYLVRTLLHNINIAWGISIGYQSPSMIAAGKTAIPVDSDITFHPDYKDDPRANPEIIGFNSEDAGVKAWAEWREYFSVDSIVQPMRPLSGIHYNELNSRNDDAFIMTPQNYIFSEGQPRPARYYLLSTENSEYKYWKSDKVSDASGNLAGATVRTYYNDWVGMNKLVLTLNIGPRPTSMTIRYLTRDSSGTEQWVTILNPSDPVPIDLKTGSLTYIRNGDGTWFRGEDIPDEQDYSAEVKAIEFTIHKLSKSNARAEVIEFEARKQLDITSRVVSLSATLTMDEADFTRIIGKISANEGKIEISNWDNAFQMSESEAIANGVERLKNTVERSTKITADLMYDLSNQGETEPYGVRMFTMYSSDWTRQSEFDYEINLFDSAKFLQNITCPEIYEKNIPVHVLVAQICDSVGFGRYALEREDYALTAPLVDYFANKPDETVWETLQSIADTAMCAIYFDEYDVLQMMTKEEITRYKEADYDIRGQVDMDNPEKLTNLSSLEKRWDQEANKVKVKWRPRSVKKAKDPLNEQLLTDIVWQSDDTITLMATKLVQPMTYAEENEFWIRQEDAYTWPFKGKANINGEVIAWEGKEYYWMDATVSPPKYYREVIHSDEELKQRQAKAVYGYNLNSVNKFTGKVMLRRDAKTNKATGRGADSSKYRIDHPINRRTGWTPGTFTVGYNGMFPGYWNGEQNTSFYTIDAERTTALGINRPTNRNDDWFKTQCLYRSASAGAKLQQWGFKFKFLESTTIGELSLIFNMGTAIGNNAEVATTLGGPMTFNQNYQVTFLETQNLVRNATHEIGAWVQTPDPVFRTFDNAIRGSASRMYNRNTWESWADRMKGYQYEFKRNVWYDIQIDLTRGRGYGFNSDMHFHVWVNGSPVGGFNAAGPANRHKFLAPTNYWAIGSRAASKVEIANAYHWTEFADPLNSEDEYRYDFKTGGYVSSHLENGLLYPAKGKSAPYRDGAQFAGEFFFDDFGSTLHEIREYDINLDKGPVETVALLASNPSVKPLETTYSPNKAKFSVVNVSDSPVLAHGSQKIEADATVTHSMVLYGYILTEGDEQTLTRLDKDSIKDRGEVRLDYDATWINNKDQADDLADWIVKSFADPKDVMDIEVHADASYSVGDKVRIHYDKADVTKEALYIVTKVTNSYSGEEGLSVALGVRRIRDNPVTEDAEL